jgi:Integrase zinc binding domain
LRLSDLNFSVQHRAGTTNHAADALSRIKNTEYDNRDLSIDIPCLTISATVSKMARVLQQLPDPIPVEELASEQLKYRAEMMAVNYTFEDEHCLWVRMAATDQSNRIVDPSSMQQRVLKLHHDSLTADHPGAKRLDRNIRQNLYWQGLTADCYSYVARCLICIKKMLRFQQKTTALRLFPPKGHLKWLVLTCWDR